MDETVNAMTIRSALLLLMGSAVAWTSAFAQPLRDPTRPPASLLAGQAGVGGAAGSAAAPEKRGPRLQSVLIARQPGGRHIAVIDGETLRLGDLYKGARVTRIEQDAVELTRGRARQVLTLHAPAPGVSSPGTPRARNE
jgi:MSHA biogenesis protein MshK